MITAILLIAVGLAVSFFGLKTFRLLLPMIGLVTGAMSGFIGFQSIFGTGIVSTAVAVMVALAVGVVLALLSFLFFRFALWLYTALLGVGLFSYLGVALGLSQFGFVIFLLGVFGFILGAILASHDEFSASAVMAFTSLAGVAFVLAGVFLIVGKLSIEDLNAAGVVSSMLKVVDQSFMWLLVWLGGALISMQIQRQLLEVEILSDQYAYQAGNTKR